MTNVEFRKAKEEGKILPYEDELIEQLRNYNIKGVPLSILVLCFDACNKNCYAISVHLTIGMGEFKLVHGDVNIYPKCDYPNHSWVERNGYVYDPTDGFRYEKDLYYKIYQPKVVDVYDEHTCKNYKFYQDVIKEYDEANISFLSIFLQYLEEQESIEPTINHNLLLEEIKNVKEKYNITKVYDKTVMDEYRNRLKGN